MPQQYDNTNRIVLFKNKKKSPGDTKPEYTGTLDVDGKKFRVSCWIKEARGDGSKFLSGSVQPDDGQPYAPRASQPTGNGSMKQQLIDRQPAPQQPFGDEQQFKEDDIPF